MSTKPDLIKDPIQPTLATMTFPMMIGIVSLMLFNLADTYFVGQLGIDELAALGFTFPVTFSIVSLAIGFGIGTSATLAKLIGSGNHTQASELSSDNLLMTALLVTALSLVVGGLTAPIFSLMGAGAALLPLIDSYMTYWLMGSVFLVVNMVANSSMRAMGDTKTPAKVMAFSSILNFALDPLFIFGWGPVPAMGIEGAALSSVIAWGVSSVVILHILYYRSGMLVLQPIQVSRIVNNWREVMRIGMPAALSNMMTPMANAVLTALVAMHGAEAVAAFGVGNRLESISLLVCLALSMTLPPFISQNFGAGQVVRVAESYKLAVKFAICWQLGVYVLLQLLSGSISQLFSDNQQVQHLIELWLILVPIGFGFQAITFLTASAFNALHQPLRAMRISVTRLFVLYVPLGWLGSHFYGLEGMFIGLVVANILIAAIAYFWMERHLNRLTSA